ncbi:MAG: hypothetical protein U9R01_09035 [candidate division WOR-3 bacterium]|nr:hypothetical protein [candidate division WOR-3 bacterium]
MKKQLHRRMSREGVVEIIRAFNSHKLIEEQACSLLGIHRSHLYRLREQWMQEGDEFRLYKYNNKRGISLPLPVKEFLLNEFRFIREEAEHSRGEFNFALLSEEVDKRFNCFLHRNTIRRVAIKSGYYKPVPGKKRKVYRRFEMAGPGMLLQHDTSIHNWIPCLSTKQVLILTKDDYSRKLLEGVIVPIETSWNHIVRVRETVLKYGIPVAYYVDNDSIFNYIRYGGGYIRDFRKTEEGKVQFSRVLTMLGVNLIHTGIKQAQAKGKIEKSFDYLQRRIPYLCERLKIKDLEGGNEVLCEVLDYYNTRRTHEETREIPDKRWKRAVSTGDIYFRKVPDGMDLDFIFSLHYPRVIRKDGTISYKGKSWKVGNETPGKIVTLCFIPGVEFMVYSENRKIAEYFLTH